MGRVDIVHTSSIALGKPGLAALSAIKWCALAVAFGVFTILSPPTNKKVSYTKAPTVPPTKGAIYSMDIEDLCPPKNDGMELTTGHQIPYSLRKVNTGYFHI